MRKISQIKIASIVFVFLALCLSAKANDQELKYCNFQDIDACFNNIETANQAFIVTDSSVREKKTDYSILFLHGLSDSPYYFKDFVKTFSPFKFNMVGVRLAGHGTTMEELNEVDRNYWRLDALQAYDIAKKLGKKVIVVGFSTGGVLSIDLYKKKPDLAGMIFLSPAFVLSDGLSKYSCKLRWVPLSVMPISPKEYGQEAKVRYPSIPRGGVCELYKLTQELQVDAEDMELPIPILMIASLHDTVSDQVAQSQWLREKSQAKLSDEAVDSALKKIGSWNRFVLIGNEEVYNEDNDVSLNDRLKDNYGIVLLHTDEVVSHSGIMLESQGFGGEVEVNPEFETMKALIQKFIRMNYL